MDDVKVTTERAPEVLPELKAWMLTAGLTHDDVAMIAGCSRSQITRALGGKKPIDADQAIRLAAVSGIPLERLVTDPETSRLLKLLGNRSNGHAKRRRR